MNYSILRQALFRMSPERAHTVSMSALSVAYKLGLLKAFLPRIPVYPVEVMGLRFPNPVGLAAGLDKNGDYVDALGALGFGFVEIGTLTPRPQPGNPKPRLFRLPEHQAIINRMGFNNKGIDHALIQVANRQFEGPVGINVGKNFDTPVEKATEDYLIGIRKAYTYADYLTVNLSSPNTPGLRTLQFGDALERLLEALKKEQQKLATSYGRYVPLAVKIAPDITEEEVRLIAGSLMNHGIDGVIATNTTLSREAVMGAEHGQEAGGLSGLPVQARSTQVISLFSSELKGQLPIIGVGGIMDGDSALAKIQAGASLVQIYTGFIYQGPKLILDCVNAIRNGMVD
jgi:dihydroorotate dehydrogenase